MDVVEKIVRVDAMFLHQAGESRSMLVEMRFLDAPGLDGIAVEQPLDIGAHALVDQVNNPVEAG
jgi:hypothetical protein